MSKDKDVSRFNKSGEVPRQPSPEDLKKVGVQKTGLVRQAADTIEKNRKEKERLLKELE